MSIPSEASEARIVDLAPMAAMEGLLAVVDTPKGRKFWRILAFDQEAEVKLLNDDFRIQEFAVPDEHLPLVRGVYGVG
jgi:hypothetical protein